MQKKILKTFQIPKLPRNRSDQVFYDENVKYIVRAKKVDYGRTLILCFFSRELIANGEVKPLYIAYFEKGDYLTQYLCNGKYRWLSGKLENIFEYYDKMVFLNQKEEILARNFKPFKSLINKSTLTTFYNNQSIFVLLRNYQDQVKKDRLTIQHKITAERYDRKMLTVPKLPNDFTKWIDNTPLVASRYAYYKRNGSKSNCSCSHCKSKFVVNEKSIYNDYTFCPHCKSKLQYKMAGKSLQIVNKGYACVLQKTSNNELILRMFRITKESKNDQQNTLDTYEYGRIFYDPQTGDPIIYYKWMEHGSTDGKRWCEVSDNYFAPYFMMFINPYNKYMDMWLYTKTLDKAVVGTYLQYSQLETYAKTGAIEITQFIERFFKYRFIEYLI